MQDIDIIVTYSDASGAVRAMRVKSDNLSKSWVWKNPSDENDDGKESSKVFIYIIICHIVTLLFCTCSLYWHLYFSPYLNLLIVTKISS